MNVAADPARAKAVARLDERISRKRQEIYDHEIQGRDLEIDLKDLVRRRDLVLEGAKP